MAHDAEGTTRCFPASGRWGGDYKVVAAAGRTFPEMCDADAIERRCADVWWTNGQTVVR
ncbi:MAG: hypothetical protein IIB61_02160 [Planctomycetes bacterium]|nr:hypothetical protein [Planctomycetota bacterium]